MVVAILQGEFHSNICLYVDNSVLYSLFGLRVVNVSVVAVIDRLAEETRARRFREKQQDFHSEIKTVSCLVVGQAPFGVSYLISVVEASFSLTPIFFRSLSTIHLAVLELELL